MWIPSVTYNNDMSFCCGISTVLISVLYLGEKELSISTVVKNSTWKTNVPF